MNPYRKEIRKVLKTADTKRYKEICEAVMLTDIERKVLDMIYCKGNDLRFIADALGYCEDWIKDIHKRALDKIALHFLSTTAAPKLSILYIERT